MHLSLPKTFLQLKTKISYRALVSGEACSIEATCGGTGLIGEGHHVEDAQTRLGRTWVGYHVLRILSSRLALFLPELWLHNIFHNWMLNSVEQRIIAEWCYRELEEAERWWWWCAGAWRGSRPCCWWCRTDSPDLGSAAVVRAIRGKTLLLRFYARLPTSWFLWPVDLLPST